jgi:hypothetical protein
LMFLRTVDPFFSCSWKKRATSCSWRTSVKPKAVGVRERCGARVPF